MREYKPCGPVGDDSHLRSVDMNPIVDRTTQVPGKGYAFDYAACDDCGYIVCDCDRRYAWSDGSVHRCTCKNWSPVDVFAVDADCHAHEYTERHRALATGCETCGHRHIPNEHCDICVCGCPPPCTCEWVPDPRVALAFVSTAKCELHGVSGLEGSALEQHLRRGER